MKLIKGILAFAIISVIAVSCNDTKKGAEKDLKQAVEKVEKSADKVVDASQEVVESGKEMASMAMAKCDGNCAKDGKSCDDSCKKEMAQGCAKDAACMKSGKCDGSCKKMEDHKCAKDAACMKSGKCDGSCKA